MKIKSLLVIMLSVCLLLCLCACGESENNDSTQTTTNGGSATTTTTTTLPTTTTTTTVDDGKVTYTVTVVDEAGNPVPGAWPQLCLESCVPVMTNAQGVATFANMNEADYEVKFMRVPEGFELPTDVYHFEKGSYELTLTLKAIA